MKKKSFSRLSFGFMRRRCVLNLRSHVPWFGTPVSPLAVSHYRQAKAWKYKKTRQDLRARKKPLTFHFLILRVSCNDARKSYVTSVSAPVKSVLVHIYRIYVFAHVLAKVLVISLEWSFWSVYFYRKGLRCTYMHTRSGTSSWARHYKSYAFYFLLNSSVYFSSLY